MDRRAFLATAGATLAVPISGCLDSGVAEREYDVGMSANAFLPERYEVAVGETVVWYNNSTRSHTVTAYETALPEGASFFATGGYDGTEAAREAWRTGGGTLAPGERFEHTFETVGEHGYFCIPHEAAGMVGTIVVAE